MGKLVAFGEGEAAIIRAAIESSEYKWRTVRGLAHETGLPEETVLSKLNGYPEVFLRSTVQAEDGRDLYSTRKHYRRKTSFISKLVDGISSSST